uniref:Four and a half LIM domains 2 n=1 Tax=Hucho hucho TaxID=62062 RepID=A0A4W5NZ09_9TELE
MTERYDCHYCKESLFGNKYVLREENPYCVKCYESLYSNTCEDCKKPIGCNTRDLSYKDHHWHEECFQCFQCKRSLVDKPFSTKDDQLLCTECYSNEYSSKCHECKKTIMPGSRKMEHKGNSWHETCFTCQRCQQPIGTKSFIPKENHNFCVPCYEKQFAMQCVHCKKPITTGGVTYRDQPWHKDCFLCTGCKQQLSGQRFTSRDDFAYCLNCFCNLYAKKCASCTTPISGKLSIHLGVLQIHILCSGHTPIIRTLQHVE